MVNTETWQQYKVGDLTTWKSGGTPSKNNDSYWNGNIPWISAKTFDKNEVCDSETKISEQGLRNGSRLADVDSVLLLVRGSGLFNRLPVGIVTKPVAFNQDIKAIEVRKEKITPRFFLYWLEGNKDLLFSKLELTGIGAGKFDIDILKGLPIHLPTLEEQDRIVSIIKNIDDKIELNRQTTQTLEAIAQAIFKEWFVDFNFPGATGEMQESELGEKPKGWEVRKLREIVELNPKLSIKKGNSAKYVEMKDLSETSLSINRFIQREFTSGSKFQNGDTLFARITPCLENGKTGLVDFLDEGEVGWGSTEFIVLRGKDVSSYFVYCLSRFEKFRDFAIQSMVGSSGRQRVVESILSEYKLFMPPIEVTNLFHDKVNSTFKEIKVHHEQTNTLIQLRDRLLPKLMRGEI